jgi:hypothetical protein
MHIAKPVRHAVLTLLLPLVLAGCGGGGHARDYPPLTYDYLPQIRLNVASVEIDDRFVPAGRDDVTANSPVKPVAALKQMAQDRLKPFGNAGRAVLVIKDASLQKTRDQVIGTMSVELDVYASDDKRAGFAIADVAQKRTGDIDDLRGTLYDLTKLMMDRMNVELEYQVRRSLRDWLLTGNPTATPLPVQQQDLEPPPQH